MLRGRLTQAYLVSLATIAMAGSVRAQDAASRGRLLHMPLPGGSVATPATSSEQVSSLRSQLLVDFIRRTYDRPLNHPDRHDDAALQSLLAGIGGSNGSGASGHGTLPLPLPAEVWIDTVFAGRESPATLLQALLRARGPALLYHGLLSLDDATRAWLVTQPQLVAELASNRAASFVIAAPGLRIRNTAVDVPGGEAAVPVWEFLVGQRTVDPAAFTRALLAGDEGRLALLFGTMAQLTPGQLRVALRLDSPDAATRVDAARRLRAVFERVTLGWRADNSAFWRPMIDPTLLLANLRPDSAGLPVVPGTRQFWTAVLGNPKGTVAGAAASTGSDPVDFAWLCEQVFTGNRLDDRRRYDLVLFVSRLDARNPHWSGPEAIAAARAARIFPALIFSLERAKLADVAAFAAAARRADSIAAIRDDQRATRTLAQFQGALALVTRVASRGGVTPEALATVVSSLSAVELSDRGDYDGRLVRWLTAWLSAHRRDTPAPQLDVRAAGSLERDALAALAGPAATDPRFVEWEGTRYRIDFPSAEGLRIARLLGPQSRPFLSSADALVAMAEAIGRDGLTAGQAHAETLDRIARSVGWEPADGWAETDAARRYRDCRVRLQRTVAAADVRTAARLAAALRALADDLLARGLVELAYAVALGQPDRTTITADEAGRRHDFGPRVILGRSRGWELPSPGMTPQRGWRVTGSLLALDVRLAEYALQRLSSKPPSKPTLASDQRRVLVETVALVEAAALQDSDRALILSAIRKGRARLAAARTPREAALLADEVGLSPSRRTLLSWAITADRDALPTFLSLGELLWLGLERAPIAPGLHAWGAPASARTGCLCLELQDRQAWETLAGRPHSGALASGFPDLNLRLAELLDQLQMPAQLLAPVLAAATLDLVDTAASRDPDDRQALLDFVWSLRPARVEEYLALLTTNGPLVPVDPGAER